jgi:hypothetical protein
MRLIVCLQGKWETKDVRSSLQLSQRFMYCILCQIARCSLMCCIGIAIADRLNIPIRSTRILDHDAATGTIKCTVIAWKFRSTEWQKYR